MTNRKLLAVVAASLLFCVGIEAAPVSKKELLALVDRGTETSSIVARVKRDCVDFDIDGKTLAQLCGLVPPDAILAAIECREARSATRPIPAVPSTPPSDAVPAIAPATIAPAPIASPATAPPVAAPVDPSEALLRIASTSLKGGCYLFVDTQVSVTQLRVRGTPTTGWRLGSWESEFRGEQLWRLDVDAKSGFSKAAVVPSGRHAFALYCDSNSWRKVGASAELEPGHVHSLLIESTDKDHISIQGVRREPADTPPPSASQRVYARRAE